MWRSFVCELQALFEMAIPFCVYRITPVVSFENILNDVVELRLKRKG